MNGNHRARTDDDVLGVVGVGFGPSNLGLAIAIEEHNETCGDGQAITAEFVESKAEFGWHTGMLIPGTTMQISFLKDLASQRNVRSRYTFLSYLTERGRLNEFINHQTFFPTRLEFHDYLEWAADAGATRRCTTAPGRSPSATRATAWPSTSKAPTRRNAARPRRRPRRRPAAAAARRGRPRRRASSTTTSCSTSSRSCRRSRTGASSSSVPDRVPPRSPTTCTPPIPDAEVHGVFAKYGYSPADDSPYANRVFDPAAVDDFYTAEPTVRQRLLDYHRATNYSCVDLPLIEALYAREYAERVAGNRRLYFHGASGIAVGDRGRAPGYASSSSTIRRRRSRRSTATRWSTRPASRRCRCPTSSAISAIPTVFAADGPEVERDYRLRTAREVAGRDLPAGRHRAHPRSQLVADLEHRGALRRDRRIHRRRPGFRASRGAGPSAPSATGYG